MEQKNCYQWTSYHIYWNKNYRPWNNIRLHVEHKFTTQKIMEQKFSSYENQKMYTKEQHITYRGTTYERLRTLEQKKFLGNKILYKLEQKLPIVEQKYNYMWSINLPT
jgi:hypothetical protein